MSKNTGNGTNLTAIDTDSSSCINVIKLINSITWLSSTADASLINKLTPDNEILLRKAHGSYYNTVPIPVGNPYMEVHIAILGCLDHNINILGATRIVVFGFPKKWLPHLSYYARTAFHPGLRRTYDTLMRKYFWPYKNRDVHTLVAHCSYCAQCENQCCRERRFLPLTRLSPLEVFAIEIFGLLPKTLNENR